MCVQKFSLNILIRVNGVGNANTSNGGGGGKQTLSISDTRAFKRVTQTSSNATLSGGTMVSVKQEGTQQENLVPSYVDSTTFLNSPNVQQQTNARQQNSTQNVQQRSGDDCESVSLPSKLGLILCINCCSSSSFSSSSSSTTISSVYYAFNSISIILFYYLL